jgi:hypothetical protein
MKLAFSPNIIRDAFVVPDTISPLETGKLSINSPAESGSGRFVLQDADIEKVVDFFYGSREESIAFFEQGANLFKGKFSFKNALIDSQFRVPKDMSFSKNTAKIRFNFIGNNQEPFLGSVTSIFLKPGPPSMDVEGPIFTYETYTGRNLRSGDHINENTAVKIRFSDPSGINLTGKKGPELIIKDQLSNRASNISKL